MTSDQEQKPLDLKVNEEWLSKRAALEGDLEVGVGKRKLTICIDPTPEELEELHRLAHRLPKGHKIIAIDEQVTPIGVRCTGCGMPWDDDRLAAEKAQKPGLISCCPERKMVPVYTAPPPSATATTHLDWSGFQGVKINKEWMPDDQELIYTALGVYEGDGDMDDDAKEQIIERLLAAWQRSSSPSPSQDAEGRD